MNVRDGQEVTGLLLERGYRLTPDEESADVILYNTCSVREQAENRVWSNMGRLKGLKARRPEVVIGMMGCMAKAHRADAFRRMPHLDFISGPAQLYEVPELIEAIFEERRPMQAIQEKRRPRFQQVEYHAGKVTALVTVMEGCDKVCSYCIIPYTRGPEVSRPMAQVLEEVRGLAQRGYKEAMLLGQNVNSYGRRFSGEMGETGRSGAFPELLAKVNEIEGIERIRFITSHPWDAVEGLFDAMRDLPKVCEHLHLPVQSGSDEVLKRMRRGYTASEYLSALGALRQRLPEGAVSTDLIVGFPGETEEDFEGTVRLVEQARFDSAFIFKYSPRPFAAASRWADDVPEEVKDRRLQRLLKLQETISRQKDERFVGKTVELLVEGVEDGQGMGRSRCSRKGYFPGAEVSPGETVLIRVEAIRGHSLMGVRV